jgi:ribonuclease Z
MDSHVHFITTPTADTPGTTLMLMTPRKHYIFGNETEGTQRALTQMGYRLGKAQDFFITGKADWSNMGGLIGMALTLADTTSTSYASAMETYRAKNGKKGAEPPRPKLNLYGPPNLKHMLATCRRFIFRKGLPIVATEHKAGDVPTKSEGGDILPSWKDDNIQVWAMSVKPLGQSPDAKAQADLDSKKRIWDEVNNNFEDHRAPDFESPEARERRYDGIRNQVLNAMFDSKWSFDTLVERHISEVDMPTVMYTRDPATNHLEVYKGPMPGSGQTLPDIQVLTRTPWPGAMILSLPPTEPILDAVSYIICTHPARGKFDPKRAMALGVKRGPAFSQLTDGNSVVNENGETITPEMVLGPERPGQGFAILDVPSVGHLESIVLREEFASSTVMEGIQAFVWILGPGVSGHPTLIQFMEKLNQIKHVISSADENPNRLALDSVAAQTIRLGQIDPERYHLPLHDNSTLPQKRLYGGVARAEHLGPNALLADRGLHFRLMPTFEISKESIPPLLDTAKVAEETAPEIIELAKAAQQTAQQGEGVFQAWRQLVARPDTEVITLGTGSALPSKYRNVSSTLVRVPNVGNYLFDCGENTLGQLQRLFNSEELADVLRNLRMIWISHLHADHHLGTASVIKAWYTVVYNGIPDSTPVDVSSISSNTPKHRLSVISHDGMLKWLHEYSAVEDFGYSRLLPLQITPVPSGSNYGSTLAVWPSPFPEKFAGQHSLRQEDYESVLGLSDIQACRVAHCHGAMAVSLTFPHSESDSSDVKPLKVSYSGDCRPSSTFARMGRDTTVLIHEATFDDELQGDAVAKKHSTTSEALGIGAKMDAKAVVLTHFSQRYQKIPILETIKDGEDEDTLLNPEAMEDVQQEDEIEDVDADAPADNADMTTTNLRGPAVPSDQAAQPQQSTERVIKVRSKDMKVAVAFDYMRVKIGDIAKLETFNAALNKLLLNDDDEKLEDALVNEHGKKTSSDEAPGSSKKKKKAKRNN